MVSMNWRGARAAVMAGLGGLLVAVAQAYAPGQGQRAVGVSELAATPQDGPVTVYYPTDAPAQTLQRGPFQLQLVPQATPLRGNGRLVVVSHGSGGSPWVHADLASALVQAGFVVAMPQHRRDNHQDPSRPGPDSWSQRPAEVSRAIDAVGRDARLAPLLDLSRVGMYGMSAGGHTALELAGGQWSPSRFRDHCLAHLRDDFHTCVGLATQLSGSWLDGVRSWVAEKIIAWRFGDNTARQHVDPRLVAIVAGVPLAADFDMATLAQPRVPLGLVTAQQDRWLIPRFHSDRVLQACLPRCELLADLSSAGHGALLSPLPPGFTGLEAKLLNDPAGFDRRVLPELDRKIVAFFSRHVLGTVEQSATPATTP